MKIERDTTYPHQPRVHSTYLQAALDPKHLKDFFQKAPAVLRQFQFEAIAFRGISGALVAPTLAHLMDKSLIVVRKPRLVEESHSFERVEGDHAATRYLLVDDFTNSGNTLRAILTDVHRFNPFARCIGMLFYYNAMACGLPMHVTQNAHMIRDCMQYFEQPRQEGVEENSDFGSLEPQKIPF